MSTVFVNGTIIARDRLIEGAMLTCRDGKIVGIRAGDAALPKDARVVDAGGGYISPGFVDLHVHGGAPARTLWTELSQRFRRLVALMRGTVRLRYFRRRRPVRPSRFSGC